MTEQELLNYLKRINQTVEQLVTTVGSMAVSMNEDLRKEMSDDKVRWSKTALDKFKKRDN